MGDAGAVVAGQQLHRVLGQLSACSAARNAATSAAFERAADELPRSSTALPDLRVSPNASTVTFGLPS